MIRQNTEFIRDDRGTITHVVKHLRPDQIEVFEALQALNDPHLPKIFRIVHTEDECYAEYDFIRGSSLEEVTGMDDEELLRVALDITQALCCIHSAQTPIVHRDIKPGNIVHRSHGGYALIDFDAARLFRDDANHDTMLDGTPGYAPPEQMGYMQTDARSDIYALGATLYELKTGYPYHAGDECPGKLQRIIKKCTAFSPEDRYRTVLSLKRALLHIKEHRFHRLFLPVLCLMLGLLLGLLLQKPLLHSPLHTQECICKPDPAAMKLVAPNDGLIELKDGQPAVFTLTPDVTMSYAEECPASVHHQPELVGVRLKRCTLGGKAEVSESGQITLYEEGVYEFDAMISCNSALRGPVSITVIAAVDLRAYTECRCVFDIYQVDYIRPVYSLPADGSPLQIDLKFNTPVIDDRLCKSEVHAKLLFMPAGCLDTPEGSDVRVDENNVLHTTTPGNYQLDIPMWFRLSEEDSFHFDIRIR